MQYLKCHGYKNSGIIAYVNFGFGKGDSTTFLSINHGNLMILTESWS